METCGIVEMADGHRDENVSKKMVLACNLWSIDPGGI